MYHQRFKSLEQRFSEKYKIEESGCWVWVSGEHRPQEHPKIWCDGGYRRASHLSWEMANEQNLLPGDQILHKCDNPRCVNPSHLFIGDHLVNMQDKARKGRAHRPLGALNGRAKLSAEAAEKIVEMYANSGVSQQAIADVFAISQQTVSRIIRGESWK